MRFTKIFVTGLGLMLCLICGDDANANDTTTLHQILAYSDKAISTLDKKAKDLQSRLDQQTDKYFDRLSKAEKKLYKKLFRKDSSLARSLFENVDGRYKELKNVTDQGFRVAQTYLPHLDSMTTALNFLQKDNFSKHLNNSRLSQTLQHYNDLQRKLNQSDRVKEYLNNRQQLLREQLQQFGMLKELKKFRKHVYYYKAQIAEYKALIENPSKLEAKLTELLFRLPQVKDFFAKSSALRSIFPTPGGTASSATDMVQALPTRASLTQAFSDRFGGLTNAGQALQQNIQAAQGQVSDIQSRIASFATGTYGNTSPDLEMLDYKPNAQKTKTFWERLEYGTNLQTQRSSRFFPTTSDFALSLGYKLNDKSALGIGASYKIGWGQNIQNFQISSEGIGFRSYADVKLKGSFYASGGFEYNYQKPFGSLQQIQALNDWQQSGLIGVSKVISLKTKFFKKSKVQLLYDFLSNRQQPRSQALKFRIGYNF